MMEKGDTDTWWSFMTRGLPVHNDCAYYIAYETETTGYEGLHTTVKVADDARKVSMLRPLGAGVEPLSSRRAPAISAIARPHVRRGKSGVAADVIGMR